MPTEAELDRMLFDLVIDQLRGKDPAPVSAVPTDAELRDQARATWPDRPAITAREVPWRHAQPAPQPTPMKGTGKVGQHQPPAKSPASAVRFSSC
jgi:hypothetical protein